MLSARIRIGENLEVLSSTMNNSNREVRLTEVACTYLYVGDIENVRVLGLDKCEYVDLANRNQRRQQSKPIVFERELDRLFVSCYKSSAIKERKLGRAIPCYRCT